MICGRVNDDVAAVDHVVSRGVVVRGDVSTTGMQLVVLLWLYCCCSCGVVVDVVVDTTGGIPIPKIPDGSGDGCDCVRERGLAVVVAVVVVVGWIPVEE